MKMTFMFGLVVFGNLIDNVSQPKFVLIIFQIALGLCWIFTGILVEYSLDYTVEELDEYIKNALFLNLNIAQFFASGILILCILQLSNWFTRKNINKTLALFILSQFAGYMTPMTWIDLLYFSVQPIVYYFCGSGLLLVSISDHYLFAFHPLEKNIFLDQDFYE